MSNASYLIVMSELVSLRFAFVRPHNVHHLVPFQESPSNIGPKVSSSSSERIGNTSFRWLRITPQNIKNLAGKIKPGSVLLKICSRWVSEINTVWRCKTSGFKDI